MDSQTDNTQYAEEKTQKRSSFGSVLSAIFRWLVRLFLVVLIGAIVGAILYYVFINIYRQAIEPLQNNAARIAAVETSQAVSRQQRDTRLEQYGERLAVLEDERTLDMESLDGLQGDLQALDKALKEQDSLLDEIEKLQEDLDNLEDMVTYEATQVMGLVATQQAEGAPINIVQQELKVVKAMQLLSRSRLYLIQNNYGSAKLDIENTQAILNELGEAVPAYQVETIQDWIARLDLAAENLPDNPALASDDMEIAWRLLVEGLPQETSSSTAEPYVITATPLSKVKVTATATPQD